MSNRNHQDDARRITVDQYSHPVSTVRKNSWPKALYLSVSDNKRLFAREIVRLATLLFATDASATTWNVANDFLLPVVGFADEPLLLGEVPLGALLAVVLYRKVKPYRYSYK